MHKIKTISILSLAILFFFSCSTLDKLKEKLNSDKTKETTKEEKKRT